MRGKFSALVTIALLGACSTKISGYRPSDDATADAEISGDGLGEPDASSDGADAAIPDGVSTDPDAGVAVDTFGTRELFTTVTGGRTWASRWHQGSPRTLASGQRDPQDAEFIVRGNGLVAIDGAGIAAVSGVDIGGVYQSQPRMYVYDEPRQQRWNNVEVTFYGMRVSENDNPSSQGLVVGTRSEHQDSGACACAGAGYYGRMLYDGRVTFQKEIVHHSTDGYSSNQVDELSRFWDSPDMTLPRDVWIGFKLVVRNQDQGQHVHLELYRDLTDGAGGGTWEKLVEYTDAGGWTNPALTVDTINATCSGCAYIPTVVDEIIVRPGTSTFIRNDGVTEARYKKWTIREIEALP
jgi:hypothetical protein